MSKPASLDSDLAHSTDGLFRSILEDSDFGLIVLDQAGRVFFWNAWMASVSGVDARSVSGRRLTDVFPELVDSRTIQVVNAAIENGQSAYLSRSLNAKPFPLYRQPKKDKAGDALHQTVLIRPLANHLPGCQIQIFDATPQALREAKLRRQAYDLKNSEERYRTLAETSTVGIWHLDLEGRTLNANLAMCNILGVGAVGNLVGKRMHDFLPLAEQTLPLSETFAATAGKQVREIEIVGRRSGTKRRVEVTLAAVSAADGETDSFIATVIDITERAVAEQAVRHLARHDPLTDLPNRRQFNDELEGSLKRAAQAGKSVSLLYLDLDHFKSVNDQLGHAAGDKLLVEVANRLCSCVRADDVVARLGGDEFAAIVSGADSRTTAVTVAERILNSLCEPITHEGNIIQAGISIGIATYPDDADKLDALLRAADLALYQAKKEGRNTHKAFDHALDAELQHRVKIESEARSAIQNNEFVPYFQPQIDPVTMKVVAAEVLIRWDHPDGNILSAGHFIDVLENNGLILMLGEQMLRRACEQGETWRRAGIHPMVIAVNVSVRELMETRFLPHLKSVLQETGFPPELLELEVTESTIVKNIERLRTVLSEIRALGVQVAIDDFGAGYSSFMLLRSLPFDVLKIDQAFVRGEISCVRNKSIRKGIIQTAQGMGCKSVAEGLEDLAFIDLLAEEGCTRVQGFGISEALSADEFTDFVSDFSARALGEVAKKAGRG